MAQRKFKNWISGLMEYVEDTEAPREYWMWSGLFTLSSVLQRRVWLPYGLANIYPNLYILVSAPPAAKKAWPATVAKQMLLDLKLAVSVDSTSKRALTKELEIVSKLHNFYYNGKQFPQTSMAIISKELSSLFAVDPKGMVEILTDLFDSHDEWKYKTSTQGADYLPGVCVGCFLVTTPEYIMRNLPKEAIGGGFTSRFVIVANTEIHKSVPIPPIPDRRIYDGLLYDLNIIQGLIGEFSWEEQARQFFEEWYHTIPNQIGQLGDIRLHPFMGRIHVVALKTAMALRVSYSNKLILTKQDIENSVGLINKSLMVAPLGLGGYGESRFGPVTERICEQLKKHKKLSERQLLLWNYRDLDPGEFEKIMVSLARMGKVSDQTIINEEIFYFYKGE